VKQTFNKRISKLLYCNNVNKTTA